ncbi:hypothetical protein [Minwuia thermotolerans]|uniref:Uncharacterized protein n=1 Tax=Minwuia thermotolerans TaxID=2056226 RepID=A0A2M9G5I0_9PROT|nr:hypothetical protein [Minwuia thermotolerans]PJK30977.1 hypothetical protein CVT23_03690 [Minwuia thermotolerans]
MTADDRKRGGEDEQAVVAGLCDAFRRGYAALASENERLRQQVERQAQLLAGYSVRERNHRRLVEDQHHLLTAARDGGVEGTLLRIPVREAMDLPPAASAPAPEPAPAVAEPRRGLWNWMRRGAPTDTVPAAETGGTAGDEAASRAAAIFDRIRRPSALSYRPSPGLAAFSLPRGELRTIAFNLIETPEDQIDGLAEEIGEAVAINRRFAPLIVTTSRSELGALRRRRLTYESLPPFGPAISRLTGLEDRRFYYDLRFRYLIRKWRAISVVNMSPVYAYGGEDQSAGSPDS